MSRNARDCMRRKGTAALPDPKIVRIGPQPTPAGRKIEALISALELEARGRGPDAERARAAVIAYRKPRSENFMRIYIERSAEIEERLRQAGAPVAVTMHILHKAAATLTEKSQRMPLTQAALAAKLGLTPSQISRAFTALAACGAILLPRQAGKSKTWEVDASYASIMPEPGRLAERLRQEHDLAVAEQLAKARAAKKRMQHREITDEGPVADPRQAILIPE